MNFESRYFPTPLDSLKAVATNQADAYIGNLAATSFLIDKNGLSNLKIISQTPFNDYQISIAIRKDWPELVGILDKIIQKMPEREVSSIRNRWLSIRFEYGVSLFDILKWIILAAIPISIILIAIVLTNRRLRSASELTDIMRRKAEQAQKEAELANRTKSTFWQP